MSWQSYVDSNLVGTKKITKAAIHGHDGSLWATSKGFSIAPQEVQTLVKGYTDPSGVRANGLHLGGVKYIVIRADDRSIYGKKGTGGVVTVKTKQAVLIGVYEDPIQPGEATKVVEALADYLISVNYPKAAGGA
ncbi:profilin, required for normal timing of actin polymerization in response to thermal stress [Borealophlyctis nickersoniae]|nr:profilin, required for normal timing of actin polymerization in response to thermal stress [Borealophlyctis nickersoniae]